MVKVDVVPDSPSLVLRATHILLIRIDSSESSQWTLDPNGNQARVVRLTVRLEQILKGVTQQPAGSQVRIEVRQYGRTGTRYYALPGVWSDQPIQQGVRLVVFSSSQVNEAADLLVEPSCRKVLPAENSLSDVLLALQSEQKDLSLGDSLKLAEPSAKSLGHIFAEYLAAKHTGSLFHNAEEFEFLMKFMEDPALSPVARATLLDFVASEVADAGLLPQPILQRLVVTLFHLIGMPEAAALHHNLIEVYLPDVLGLNGSSRKMKATDVFLGTPTEHERAETIIRNYHGDTSTDSLKAWLRQ